MLLTVGDGSSCFAGCGHPGQLPKTIRQIMGGELRDQVLGQFLRLSL